MNIGIPVARFVSDPRLWASTKGRESLYSNTRQRYRTRTPSDDESDGRIRSTRDAEHGKVLRMNIVGDGKEDPIKKDRVRIIIATIMVN